MPGLHDVDVVVIEQLVEVIQVAAVRPRGDTAQLLGCHLVEGSHPAAATPSSNRTTLIKEVPETRRAGP
jgi:hypothetical protein